jgi:DNA invertase Pin-like site-specific DNA recombinase
VLDAAGASFVSITQAFNTTTSMGRLTLNVLLSFAQFEREVISERVRDKVAASKRKGMWMGGPVPLGYDLKERKLIINAAEAETVRHILRRYIALASVRALMAELEQAGIRSKRHCSEDGSRRGGIGGTPGTPRSVARIWRTATIGRIAWIKWEIFSHLQRPGRKAGAFAMGADFTRH